MARYAWIIDKDYIGDADAKTTGLIGPRSATREQIAELNASPKRGHKFKLYDDDNELYYDGRIIFADGGTFETADEIAAFAPLNDFGTPAAGCTDLRYKDSKTGEWKTL